MKRTIESRTAGTILERQEPVTIGDTVYQVAPPTTATLILVSELVSQMPQVRLNPENVTFEVLRIARDCKVIGDILAVLILGESGIKEERKVIRKRRSWFQPKYETITIDHQAELASIILKTQSPGVIEQKTAKLLSGMEIGSFFGFTTSLIEVNLTKATREVVETTASGR